MTANILVTGGCGFVGAPLVRLLTARGDKVTAYDNLSRGRRSSLATVSGDLQIVEGDIADADRLGKVLRDQHTDIIIHLAALHFIPDCDADPEHCLATNVLGTQIVLQCAEASTTVRGLIYASTAAVYEPSMEPHDESSRLGPIDVYGNSKLAGEQLVNWASSRTGMPAGIARLFNVYGPHETNLHLIPTVIAQAQSGDGLVLGNLSTRRDYVFTDDVARAFASFTDLTLTGRSEVCNIGTGMARSGDEVVSAICRALHQDMAPAVDENRFRPIDRPVLCAEVGTAEELLDWKSEVTFEAGIHEAIQSPLQDGRS